MKLAGIVLAGLVLVQATKQPPTAPPVAQNTVIIVSCRVDDLTGQPGRQDPSMAAKGWRDLELHVQNGQYECRRDVIANIVDQEAQQNPTLAEEKPNLGKPETCARVGITLVPRFEQEHPGWSVVAIGCPSPNIDKNTGATLSYHLPACPEYLPGTNNPMRCEYDDSAI